VCGLVNRNAVNRFRRSIDQAPRGGGALAFQEGMRHLALPLLLIVTAPVPAFPQEAAPPPAPPTMREQVLALGVSEEIVVADYPALPLRDQASAATAVVHVTVRGGDSFLSGDGQAILTDYRMIVVDVLKDATSRLNAGDVVTVRRTGGVTSIAGRKVFSSENGFPAFSAGGEYVLFLKADAGQPFEMLAGPQSAFRVHQGTITPVADERARTSAVLMPLFVHEVKDLSRANGTR
jgi:hypothetical protein